MNLDSVDIHAKGIVRYPPGATLGPRAAWDYEFVWIVSGDCQIDIDGVEYPAPPESVFLLRPGQKVFFRWDREKTTVHGFVHFGIKRTIPGLGAPASWPIAVNLDQREDILRPLLRYAAGIASLADPAVDSLVRANLLQALIVFVKRWHLFGEVSLPAGNEVIRRLYRTIHVLIDQDRHDQVNLHSLARIVKVSPEYLCRLTRQVLSITPMELVYRIRIEKASGLLARTDFSIKQIAQLLGFSNIGHFSRRFKSQTKLAPGEYRRQAHVGRVTPFSHFLAGR